MAGFRLINMDTKPGGFLKNIQKNIRNLSILGMKWDEKIIKQSKSVGIAESQLDSMYNLYYQNGTYPGTDYGQKEFIAFYDKEYPTRRDFLRKFAMNGEVEHVLEVICDETIIYDDNNYFCYPNTQNLKSIIKDDKAKEIINDLNESFRKVYFAAGFNQGHDAWHYLKKFLIDGFLSFEIIYDGEDAEDAKEVIHFKEIDPISLEPEIRNDEDGNEIRVWVQYRGDTQKERELLDANLIYLSWARGNFISRLSYVERLVRSFNMLRTLENSRIIWNVWNAQYRIKIVTPIGTQSEAKARTRLSELRAMYKEELNIDEESGEVTYNGSPQFSFAKTYIFPSKNGEHTEIDGFQPQGYNLSDTDSLKYFWMRYVMETKVPSSRFANDPNGGNAVWGNSADSVAREEIGFSNFTNRIQSMFQEILLKPTWIQFILKHPEFKKDEALKSAIGLKYNEENIFKIAKERSNAEKGANTIQTMMGVTQPTISPTGEIAQIPYFDPKFLVEKYLEFSDADIKLNTKYKKERNTEMKKLADAYSRIAKAKGEEQQVSGEGGLGGFGGEGGLEAGGGFGGETTGGFRGGDIFGGKETTGFGEELPSEEEIFSGGEGEEVAGEEDIFGGEEEEEEKK